MEKYVKARKWEMEGKSSWSLETNTKSEKLLHPFVVMDLFCHKFALFKAKI
jgi:hypothetical protein